MSNSIIVLILILFSSYSLWFLVVDKNIEESMKTNRIVNKNSIVKPSVPSVPSERTGSQSYSELGKNKSRSADITLSQSLNIDQHKEVAIDKVESRQNYYNGLLEKDVRHVWYEWSSLFNSNEARQRNIAANAFAQKLQNSEKKNGDIYSELEGLLYASEIKEKKIIINLLSLISTKQSMELLTAMLVDASPNSDLQLSIILAIDKSSENLWGGIYHKELSIPLENLWKETSDPKIQIGVSRSIAKIGREEGVKMLLDEIEKYNTLESLLSSDDTRAQFAYSSIDNIRNIEAIPTLMNSLNSLDIDDAVFNAKVKALSSFGNSDATEILLYWAKNTESPSTNLASKLFLQIRDTRSLERVKYVLGNEEFKSDSVKRAIANSISKIDTLETIKSEIEVTSPKNGDSNSESYK